MRKIILSLLACAFLVTSTFAELITITCDFYTFAAPGENGNASPTDMKNLKFVVDTEKGTGTLVGNAGAIEVAVVEGEDMITFIQVSPIVTTTTVQLSNKKAVHSRNVILMGEFMPTQYYGKATSIQ